MAYNDRQCVKFLIADDVILDVDHTDSILLKHPTTATAKLIYGCLGQNRYENSKPRKPIHSNGEFCYHEHC